MIQANELRVGNRVSEAPVIDNSTHWHHSVVNVDTYPERIIYVDNGDGFQEDQLYPIPLTPEILEKLGFKSTGDGYFLFPLTIERYEDYYTLENYDVAIKHVHQLQNIYHALTGKELEINYV